MTEPISNLESEPIILDPPPGVDFIPKDPNMPMNKYLQEVIKRTKEMEEQMHQLLLAKAPQDLFIFNKYVLGVEKDRQKLGAFHKTLCHFITDDQHKKKLILIPRSHLKSTLITIGRPLQRIVKDQNTRVLILNAVYQLAVDFLSEIKKHLAENQKILELFGPIAQDPLEWSEARITLQRTHMNIKEPTIQAAGIETSLVGSHYDLIIMDDPVNRENSATREQIQKIILKFKDVIDLLEPGGELIIIGTRWVEGELYSWLMDKDNEVSKSFNTMILKAYTGNLQTGENLDILWKERFTQKELLTRLADKGIYEFSSQYLNNPIPPEDADFKREWFQYFEMGDYRGSQMDDVLTIDPAISQSKEADYTAMVLGGIDQFTNIFIKDIYRKKVKPGELIDDIFRMYEIWHPRKIVIETIAFQKVLAYMINEEMRRRGKMLPIYEIKAQDKNKEMRIKGLQPVYMNKKIYHRKDIHNTQYLEDELLTFPRGAHDDVADAVSMLLDFLTPPKQKGTRYHSKYLY